MSRHSTRINPARQEVLWQHGGATSTTPATPNNSTPMPTLYFLAPVHCDSRVETEPLFGSSPRACINKLCTEYKYVLYKHIHVYTARIIKESKAKASICFIGTRRKICIFRWIRVLRGARYVMCNILLLLIWIRRISVGWAILWEILRPWILFSEQGSSITTSLSQYPYGCTHEPITQSPSLASLASFPPLVFLSSLSETPYAAPGFFMLSVRHPQPLAS